jgi:hypothetical protein
VLDTDFWIRRIGRLQTKRGPGEDLDDGTRRSLQVRALTGGVACCPRAGAEAMRRKTVIRRSGVLSRAGARVESDPPGPAPRWRRGARSPARLMACPHAQRLCDHRRALGAGSRLLHPRRRRSVTLRESAQQRLITCGAQSAPPSAHSLTLCGTQNKHAIPCSTACCGNELRQQRQKLQSRTQKLQSRSRPEETWFPRSACSSAAAVIVTAHYTQVGTVRDCWLARGSGRPAVAAPLPQAPSSQRRACLLRPLERSQQADVTENKLGRPRGACGRLRRGLLHRMGGRTGGMVNFIVNGTAHLRARLPPHNSPRPLSLALAPNSSSPPTYAAASCSNQSITTAPTPFWRGDANTLAEELEPLWLTAPLLNVPEGDKGQAGTFA